MDEQKVLAEYKTGKKQKNPFVRLGSGEVVVGTEVDADNHLYYVIEGQEFLRLERAEGQQIAEVLIQPRQQTITISPRQGEIHMINSKNISKPPIQTT